MIKRTLYFGNPAYLSLRMQQLEIRFPEVEKSSSLPDFFKETTVRTIPIEDIGVVVLDNRQITITQGAIDAMLDNNVALITCDKNRMPVGLLLPLDGNRTQNERFNHQSEVTSGVLEEECGQILSNFFRELRQKKKEEKRKKRTENE